MYYISPAALYITDEMTRTYLYFQLKSDLVNGKLNCDRKEVMNIHEMFVLTKLKIYYIFIFILIGHYTSFLLFAS